MIVQKLNASLADTRKKLYANPHLGASNFLFIAHHSYADKEKIFLWCEEPFMLPDGGLISSFHLNNLLHTVKMLAAWYLNLGITRTQKVCLYLSRPVAPFIHFLALTSIGAIPVLINHHLSLNLLGQFMANNQFKILIHDISDFSNAAQILPGIDVFNSLKTTSAAKLLDKNWPVEHDEHEILMICHTSGTTNVPKTVAYTHAQFFSQKRERLLSFVKEPQEKMLVNIPASHAAGISYLMTAVILQLPTMHANYQQDKRLIDIILQFKPTLMLSFMCTYRFLAKSELPLGSLSFIKRFYNTADPARHAHVQKILKLAPSAIFIDMLGSSELGMAQFFKTHRLNDAPAFRNIGTEADYANSAILNPAGNVLEPEMCGYLGIKSPTITPGYYNKSYLSETNILNGYWLTGDVGKFNQKGELIHLDRITDVIHTPQHQIYSLLLEEQLLVNNQIIDVIIIGVKRGATDEECVIVLIEAQDNISLDQVIHQIIANAKFNLPLLDYAIGVALLAPSYHLPLGSTGKVLKRKLRDDFWQMYEAYLAGDKSVILKLRWNHEINKL